MTAAIRPRRQKISGKSLPLIARILKLVEAGFYEKKIARDMQLDRQNVSYHLKTAEECGYIERCPRSSITPILLTGKGKKILAQYERGEIIDSRPPFRLEHITYAAPVLKMPRIPPDWKRVSMNNWAYHDGEVDGVKVRLIEGVQRKIQFTITGIDGDSQIALLHAASHQCFIISENIMKKFGMKLGFPEPVSKPEWVVYDPVAKAVCKQHGQVTVPGVGKVNASAPRHRGELEFYDPLDVAAYLSMPLRIEEIETRALKRDFGPWHYQYTNNS